MKNAPAYARKLSAFLAGRRRRHTHHDAPSDRDLITQLIIAFLQWESTRKGAEAAYKKLMHALVDNNDVRVSHPDEIAAILGERYPRAAERAARMHDVLQEVFVREHVVSLDPLVKLGKKEARAYLDSLPGMTPYVASLMLLICNDGHAIPVDQKLADRLLAAGLIDPSATLAEIASFIEHHTKAGRCMETHLLLQDWSDQDAPASRAARPKRKPAKSRRK